MEEALITTVVPQACDESVELEIRIVGDVLEWRLNGKLIFSSDWQGNLLEVFKRAIELWDKEAQ